MQQREAGGDALPLAGVNPNEHQRDLELRNRLRDFLHREGYDLQYGSLLVRRRVDGSVITLVFERSAEEEEVWLTAVLA